MLPLAKSLLEGEKVQAVGEIALLSVGKFENLHLPVHMVTKLALSTT